MTDQKNPPRTREEQKIDIARRLTFSKVVQPRDLLEAERQLTEAEARGDAAGYARGRAEALAELCAGAEPIYQVWFEYEGWNDMTKADWEFCSAPDKDKRIVYLHPPVPREAELAAVLREAGEAFDRIGGAMAACKSRPRAGVCGQTVDAMIRASDFTIPGVLVLELGERAELIRATLAAARETRG